MSETKLFDMTKVLVVNEIELQRRAAAGNPSPLLDPKFERHVGHVTTKDERERATDRLLWARRRAS